MIKDNRMKRRKETRKNGSVCNTQSMHIKRWSHFYSRTLFATITFLTNSAVIQTSYMWQLVEMHMYEMNGLSLKWSNCIHVFIVQFKTTSITMTTHSRNSKRPPTLGCTHINKHKNYDERIGKRTQCNRGNQNWKQPLFLFWHSFEMKWDCLVKMLNKNWEAQQETTHI